MEYPVLLCSFYFLAVQKDWKFIDPIVRFQQGNLTTFIDFVDFQLPPHQRRIHGLVVQIGLAGIKQWEKRDIGVSLGLAQPYLREMFFYFHYTIYTVFRRGLLTGNFYFPVRVLAEGPPL